MNKEIYKKVYLYILMVLSAAGMFDTLYLASKSLKGESVACGIFNGCDRVLGSAYATFLGYPISIYGFFFYISILVLIVCIFNSPRKIYYKVIVYISNIAFLASLFFFYLQVHVLEAYCLYCLISLGLTTLIFLASVVHIYIEKEHRQI